jgi:thioredoxin 1
MAEVIDVTAASFEQEVLRAPLPTLVDLWAEWCAPCKMMSPIVESLALAQEGRLKVTKLDVQEHAEVAARYGVTNLPTLLLFVGGELKERIAGYIPEAKIVDRLSSYLG